jgi:hypothetical protein
VFLEDQHKQSVTPLQFLGRYLQSTQTVITQRVRATAAVEHSLVEEQHKKKGRFQCQYRQLHCYYCRELLSSIFYSLILILLLLPYNVPFSARAALDIARRTKGVTEDILSKCIEELTAAEESLETCRREEGAVVSVLHSEVASLMDVQRLSVQVSTAALSCLSFYDWCSSLHVSPVFSA